MLREPLFLRPVFKERIWGGTLLSHRFGYSLPSEKTGECWGISGHPNGPCEVTNGPFKGMTLDRLWEERRELFADWLGDSFPLLVKIIDANDDLSVQVHPDDRYAQQIEGVPYGKTECWYVIDCVEGAEIVYGHRAKTREEFAEMVADGHWDSLLKRVSIRPGDFIYVPSGTVHAIGKGTLILETQQSSDVTYRLYDYDRRDEKGNTRKLHLKQSIDVVTVPHRDPVLSPQTVTKEGLVYKRFISESYFTVYHWSLNGTFSDVLSRDCFLLVSVLDGSGKIDVGGRTFPFQKGDHFILPSTLGAYRVEGEAAGIASYPTQRG